MSYLKDVKEISHGSLSENEVAGITANSGPPKECRKPLVLVINDLTVERECLAHALAARQPGFHVVAHSFHKDYRFEIRPDVVLFGVDSVDCGRDVSDIIGFIQGALPDVPIVVLAEDAEATTEKASLFDLGVSGCLSYSDGLEGLTQVLSLVLHGGACFPRESICHTRQAPRPVASITPIQPTAPAPKTEDTKSFPEVGLTARERDVVRQLRKGKPNKIIAYELGISISTVKVHVRNIMRKTGATNRVEAALFPEVRAGRTSEDRRF